MPGGRTDHWTCEAIPGALMEETRSRAASGGLRAWFLALRLLIALAAACDCSPDSGSGIFLLRGCVHGVRLDASRSFRYRVLTLRAVPSLFPIATTASSRFAC
jgi:hypothetical protein